jgi:hypothetical protein
MTCSFCLTGKFPPNSGPIHTHFEGPRYSLYTSPRGVAQLFSSYRIGDFFEGYSVLKGILRAAHSSWKVKSPTLPKSGRVGHPQIQLLGPGLPPGGAKGGGKDAAWKNKNNFFTPLGNPTEGAGFPLPHRLGGDGSSTAKQVNGSDVVVS